MITLVPPGDIGGGGALELAGDLPGLASAGLFVWNPSPCPSLGFQVPGLSKDVSAGEGGTKCCSGMGEVAMVHGIFGPA